MRATMFPERIPEDAVKVIEYKDEGMNPYDVWQELLNLHNLPLPNKKIEKERLLYRAKYIVDCCKRGSTVLVTVDSSKHVRMYLNKTEVPGGATKVVEVFSGTDLDPFEVRTQLLRLVHSQIKENNMKKKPMLVRAVQVKQLIDKGKTVWVMLDEDGNMSHTTHREHVDSHTLIGTYSGKTTKIEDINDDLHWALENQK